ncbi:MAG TPA: ECF transporter S component [Caldilineaceae bacterium]|nr:ECF transporter S component [Caldilineaceae bacterium]
MQHSPSFQQTQEPAERSWRSGMAWSQRELVTVAVIGVVFGVLYLAWVQLWLFVQGLTGPLAMDVMFGFWFLASIVAAYAIRKPGAAFLAEVIAAIAEVLTGNPSGAILLLTGVIQGAGAEVPFALTRWRNYRLPVLLASGATAAVFSFIYNWFRFSYWELAPGLLLIMFVLRVLSGMALGGWLGKLLTDRLYQTGVLQGFAIDRAKRQAEPV